MYVLDDIGSLLVFLAAGEDHLSTWDVLFRLTKYVLEHVLVGQHDA